MVTRIAVIDLGTNTFNILIADVSDNRITPVYTEEIPVKLGEGGINAGFITKNAWQRGLRAIYYIQKKITEYNCKTVKSVATSAIRSASNGEQFKLAVKEATGINIEVIDGNTEAQLIYQGVRQGVSITQTSLIMDIGGGSVEFIICDRNRIYWKDSYPVGAARLMDKFHHTDPITPTDIELIKQHLNESLTGLFNQCKIYNPQCLIGSAGAFETFAALVSIRYDQHYDKSSGEFIFIMEQFHEIAATILQSDRHERENTPGLVPFRVDMIVSATVLTQYILLRTEIESLKLSSYALKEGVLASVMDGLN